MAILIDGLLETISEHLEWASRQFHTETVLEKLEHCKEEVQEVIDDSTNITEYVDSFMLLLGAFIKSGFTQQQFLEALKCKLAINKARKWNGNHHVKE